MVYGRRSMARGRGGTRGSSRRSDVPLAGRKGKKSEAGIPKIFDGYRRSPGKRFPNSFPLPVPAVQLMHFPDSGISCAACY